MCVCDTYSSHAFGGKKNLGVGNMSFELSHALPSCFFLLKSSNMYFLNLYLIPFML